MSLDTMELDRRARCEHETHDRDENGLCHDCRVVGEQSAAEARVIAEQHAPHNVAVTVCAGPEIKMLANIANDMEANSDEPRLVWMRNGNGRIIGVTLVGHLSTATVNRSPELRYEPVGEP